MQSLSILEYILRSRQRATIHHLYEFYKEPEICQEEQQDRGIWNEF